MIMPLITDSKQNSEGNQKNNMFDFQCISKKDKIEQESIKIISNRNNQETNSQIQKSKAKETITPIKKIHNFNNICKNPELKTKKSLYLTLAINNNEPNVSNTQNFSACFEKHPYSKFTKEEDDLLKSIVQKIGPKNWRFIASLIPGRSPKQCRDRYSNYLAPGISHSVWTEEEDKILIDKFVIYGPKWSYLSRFFKNRTPNDIKNRYNYTIIHQKNKIGSLGKKL